MPEIGLEIEPEVGCVRGCGGFAVAVPEGVQRVCVQRVCRGCAEVVRRVCVWRLCGGYAEVSVDGKMSTCPMSEHVWWLCRSMCQRMWRSMCGGLQRVAEGVQRVSCYNVVSL